MKSYSIRGESMLFTINNKVYSIPVSPEELIQIKHINDLIKLFHKKKQEAILLSRKPNITL